MAPAGRTHFLKSHLLGTPPSLCGGHGIRLPPPPGMCLPECHTFAWLLPRRHCWVRDNPQDKGAVVHMQPPPNLLLADVGELHPSGVPNRTHICLPHASPTGARSPSPLSTPRIPFAGAIPGESGGRKRLAGGGTGVRAGACICARQGEGSGAVSAGGVVSARHRLTGKGCRSRRKINCFTTVTIAVSSSLQSAPSC